MFRGFAASLSAGRPSSLTLGLILQGVAREPALKIRSRIRQGRDPARGRLSERRAHDGRSLTRMQSTSICAPRGSAATPMVTRAG